MTFTSSKELFLTSLKLKYDHGFKRGKFKQWYDKERKEHYETNIYADIKNRKKGWTEKSGRNNIKVEDGKMRFITTLT